MACGDRWEKSFNEWLEEVEGISPEDFDENYDGEEEYNSYLYDGLPQFVINYIEAH